MTDKNRYFLVFYNYNSFEKKGYGYTATITNGSYIRRKEYLKSIKDQYGIDISHVQIINIIELSRSEMEDYES